MCRSRSGNKAVYKIVCHGNEEDIRIDNTEHSPTTIKATFKNVWQISGNITHINCHTSAQLLHYMLGACWACKSQQALRIPYWVCSIGILNWYREVHTYWKIIWKWQRMTGPHRIQTSKILVTNTSFWPMKWPHSLLFLALVGSTLWIIKPDIRFYSDAK